MGMVLYSGTCLSVAERVEALPWMQAEMSLSLVITSRMLLRPNTIPRACSSGRPITAVQVLIRPWQSPYRETETFTLPAQAMPAGALPFDRTRRDKIPPTILLFSSYRIFRRPPCNLTARSFLFLKVHLQPERLRVSHPL